ncbi:hypothetical protein HH303_11880 [Rhodospirillaceae bacterium KN72]|uniref:Uncharacterized protein n=1 Tax=Pacificispira spongiicola TaxID=2729598 RepID=A0A7Y0E125_9PROT|nr:hypothetical protein [Pacificispira spongiicola]NMM45183.1 hypothetical protein [Pacificispira spongiicola]
MRDSEFPSALALVWLCFRTSLKAMLRHFGTVTAVSIIPIALLVGTLAATMTVLDFASVMDTDYSSPLWLGVRMGAVTIVPNAMGFVAFAILSTCWVARLQGRGLPWCLLGPFSFERGRAMALFFVLLIFIIDTMVDAFRVALLGPLIATTALTGSAATAVTVVYLFFERLIAVAVTLPLWFSLFRTVTVSNAATPERFLWIYRRFPGFVALLCVSIVIIWAALVAVISTTGAFVSPWLNAALGIDLGVYAMQPTALSTVLVWLVWIGMAYTAYRIFIPNSEPLNED